MSSAAYYICDSRGMIFPSLSIMNMFALYQDTVTSIIPISKRLYEENRWDRFLCQQFYSLALFLHKWHQPGKILDKGHHGRGQGKRNGLVIASERTSVRLQALSLCTSFAMRWQETSPIEGDIDTDIPATLYEAQDDGSGRSKLSDDESALTLQRHGNFESRPTEDRKGRRRKRRATLEEDGSKVLDLVDGVLSRLKHRGSSSMVSGSKAQDLLSVGGWTSNAPRER